MQPTQPGTDGLGTLRAAVLPGDGSLIGRFPGVLCLATAAADEGVLSELWQLCADAAAANPAAPGGELARRLAGWLSRLDGVTPEPRFGTIAATEGGLAVFLFGPCHGPGAGRQPAAVRRRRRRRARLRRPAAGQRADAGDRRRSGRAGELADAVAGGLDLRAGTVRGRCVALYPAGAAPGGAGSSAVHGAFGPRRGVERARQGRARRADSAARVRGRARPAAGRAGSTGGLAAGERDRPKVYGQLCAGKHLNDPRALFCVVWRADRGAHRGAGRGRPRTTRRAFRGRADLHRRRRLPHGPTVPRVAAGSSVGRRVHDSYLAQPGQPVWSRLLAGRPSLLVPGTRVRIGHRGFVFDSPSAAG